MFLLVDGEICINELAPRPHNSGHYSIEACWSSQFDNHVRAVLGLPLGDSSLIAPAAAMVNLLGTTAEHLASALNEPHAFVHLYGKNESRPGRKMGHVTALGASRDEALERARRAAAHFNA
jgi:phosphoribosylaminoimidazole carboxylase (NCAIR synthetase)